MAPNLRYLACLRPSADSDGSTSIEWQRGVIRHYVAAPHVSGLLAGEAEDTDVSGSLSPFKRPKLGKWLTAKVDEFDVIIAARMDRLTRRSTHFSELLEWADANGKFIVCVEEGFDLSTPPGKMMARMTAVFAEAELNTIQARITNGVQARLENRSWLTGAPPTGYRIKAVEGGKRKVLEIDPGYLSVVDEIFLRIRVGQSTHRISRDFNARGIPTWGDHLRKVRGEATRGTQWQATIMNKLIRSPWVPGIYTYRGEAVLDDQGELVILPEKPLATMDEWTDLVDRIKPAGKPTGATEGRAAGKSLLAGIAHCGDCGAPFASLLNSGHKRKDGTRVLGQRYYRCSNKFKGGDCKSGPCVRAKVLDEWVDQAIRDSIGKWDVYVRAGIGPSRAGELQSARARLEKLEADFLAGEYDGEGQEVSYRRMHKRLSGRAAFLEKQEAGRSNPAPSARATGEKYGEVWDSKDQEDRREFLRNCQVTVWAWIDAVSGAGLGTVMDLGDIQTVAQELNSGKENGTDRLLIGHNVPAHWIDPGLREFTTEGVPECLKELTL